MVQWSAPTELSAEPCSIIFQSLHPRAKTWLWTLSIHQIGLINLPTCTHFLLMFDMFSKVRGTCCDSPLMQAGSWSILKVQSTPLATVIQPHYLPPSNFSLLCHCPKIPQVLKYIKTVYLLVISGSELENRHSWVRDVASFVSSCLSLSMGHGFQFAKPYGLHLLP